RGSVGQSQGGVNPGKPGGKPGDRRNVFQFFGSSVGFGMSNETKGVANEGAVRKPENVPSVPGFPPRRPAPPGGDARGYANRRARRRPRSQCPFGSTRWRSRAPIRAAG